VLGIPGGFGGGNGSRAFGGSIFARYDRRRGAIGKRSPSIVCRSSVRNAAASSSVRSRFMRGYIIAFGWSAHLIETTARPLMSHSQHRGRGAKSVIRMSGPSALALGEAEGCFAAATHSSGCSAGVISS
jgi:hypothetical protein